MNHTPAPEDTTNPRHAVLIGEDGAMTSLTLPADDSARLAELQRLVGGLVDVVALDEHDQHGLDMWVNDEGLYLCGPNPVATVIAAAHGHGHQMFHGPAVFTGSVDAEGNTIGLDEATALVVAGMATHAHTDGPAVRADTHTADADDDTARHHGGEPR